MNVLLLLDIQNDFLPGGALQLPAGDQVIPVANELMPLFSLVLATKDWHPSDHGSFASQHQGKRPGEFITLHGLRQILWPDHCVQDSPGAEFAPGLNVAGIHDVVTKGTNPMIDSYSGFFDNGHRNATELDARLRTHGVEKIFLMGLATDYCVKFTALDAIRLGYPVHVIEPGCRGVDLQPDDVTRALDEMRQAGVRVVGRDLK